MVKNKRGEL